MIDDEIIEHHGVKGQKWGIRRTLEQLGHHAIFKPSSGGSYEKDDVVFVSGKVKYDEPVSDVIKQELNNMTKANAKIIVGDAPGADTRVQEYLSELKYGNVTVYTTDDVVRNNVGGWKVEKISSNGMTEERDIRRQKDIAMTNAATKGFVISSDDDRKDSATSLNVERLLNKDVNIQFYDYKSGQLRENLVKIKHSMLMEFINKMFRPNYIGDICHTGTPHEGTTPHSGRFPWGSGDNAFQRPKDFYSYVKYLRRQGITDVEISKGLNMTTTELKKFFTVSKEKTRKEKVERARELSKLDVDDNGKKMTHTRIGEIVAEEFGDSKPIGESTIRLYLDEAKTPKTNVAKTAEFLMNQVDKKGMIDVGDKVEVELGVTRETLNAAIAIAENEGYVKLNGSVNQVQNPSQKTNYILLAPPGTKSNEAYNHSAIHTITDYMSTDGGKSFRPAFVYPVAINKNRVMIRYAEEGGIEKDGLIEIREGVKDLSLGKSHYAQVRILVDNGGGKNDLYLKGMAVYNVDGKMPDGYDIIFNTNKEVGTPFEEVLKGVKKNLDKDPENPFGSTIKEHGGQSYYPDPKGKFINPITGERESLSAINKRQDENDWNDWDKKVASQMLSKQPKATIAKQLSSTLADRIRTYDEIMAIENPTVKAKMLMDYADDCDTAAKNLKARAFTGMTYHVILPEPTLKDNEIYAPNYPNGTQLALIRYPHGGLFEIPILTVNNNNKNAKKMIGTNSSDAVAINAHNASILSGADFDGDTVLTIPTNNGITKIKNMAPLAGLKNFNTGEYGPHDKYEDKDGNMHYLRYGVEYQIMNEDFKQKQMGIVSNLITDMTLKGASADELVRAVKHSMVVIDACKHKLDYKQSEIDNDIDELHRKYQKHEYNEKYGGASTLISRAKNPTTIPKREEGAFILDQEGNPDNGNILEYYNPAKKMYRDPKTGKIYTETPDNKVRKTVEIDPETGEKLYHDTKEGYIKLKYRNEENKLLEVPVYEKRIDAEGNIKYRRPRYVIELDDKEALNNLYFMDQDGVVNKYDPSKHTLMQVPSTEDVAKMDLTNDAYTLSSGTIQEQYYAEYANKVKALANSARANYVYYDANPIPYSPKAREEYIAEWRSLENKVKQAELNAPRERAAQIMATAKIKAAMEAADEPLDKESEKKLRQNELVKARALLGAHNARFEITEQEWKAVQAGAFSVSRLREILRYADQDIVKKLATPREELKLSDADIRRIKGLASKGETNASIAARLHVSISTVLKYLGEEE